MRARWTTARAVSGGADLRSSWVSPILSPEKERSGRVAALHATEREEKGFGVSVSSGVGGKGNLVLGLWWERKIEDEKKAREVGVGVGVGVVRVAMDF